MCPADPAIDAEDLVQAAWLKVGARLDPARSAGEQTAYLNLIIGQLATDHHRAAKRHPILPLVDWLPGGVNVEAEAIARVELAAVLGVVPLALLLFACGYSWDEIAAAQGVPLSTPRVRAVRWRQAQTEA